MTEVLNDDARMKRRGVVWVITKGMEMKGNKDDPVKSTNGNTLIKHLFLRDKLKQSLPFARCHAMA